MPKRSLWLTKRFCAGLLLAGSVAGCKTAVQCCTGSFLSRSMTPADVSFIEDNAPTVSTDSDSARDLAAADNSELSGSRLPDTLPTNNDGRRENESAVSLISRQRSYQSDPPADSAESAASSQSGTQQRFRIPSELPGADAAPLQMPALDAGMSADERRSLVESLFPNIDSAQDSLAPDGQQRMTLASLQQMALDNSPVIRQAAADVEQARGRAVQAGLYPNPTIGYEGDTLGTARTAGYNGLFFTQEFITADKLTLAQSAAMMETRATEAELRKARITLATRVRRGYFKTLVAQEQVKFNRAIARLSEEVYQAQIDLVSGCEAAPYEPLQLRVFAVQARNNVVQAQNHLESVWRQLAATLGMPHLDRHIVAGSVQLQIPEIDYQQAAAVLLARHTDLAAARSRISSASCNLRLQQVTPIPNVTLYGAFQHDDTTPLNDYSTNVQLSMPVPVFNKNQGNIASAHGQLVRANNDLSGAQNDLMSSLAEIHARRSSALVIADSYQSDLLPDQVRVYRGVYERFRLDGESIDFSQLVVAQQTLAQVVTSYLQALNDLWDATVDLAEIMQVDDMVTMDGLVSRGE